MKKRYSKPIITDHIIDHEISLIMMTFTGDDPPPPPPAAAQGQQSSPTQENNFKRKSIWEIK